MFPKNLSFRQLLQGAAATFLRFPLTLIFAITGTAVAITFAELNFNLKKEYLFLIKTAWLCWLGLILFFVLQLFAEKYKFTSRKKALINGSGILFLVLLWFLLPEKLLIRHHIQLFLIGLGLHLTASYAPFFNPKSENGFWQFNEKLFLRFLTAALYSAVLYIGLALAITAIRELFQIRFTFEIYPDLWFLLAGVFNTWIFLAGVPQDFATLETETNYPKGLKLFTQFVLLPLVTIYLLILYGYMGKILLQWEWPRGWVSNLVLGFSIAGIFSLLLIHPIRNAEGNTWIRTYAKWFYRALFPLLILFGLAIWRRVSDYGITEERYFVLVLAFWLLAVALYFLFSRQKNIKFIPFTLSILAFLVAFGPWGAFSVSLRSQTSRLRQYFEKNGMLSGGKVLIANKKIPARDEAEISSILTYLEEMHHFESVKPWFGVQLDTMLARIDTMRYHQNVTINLVESLNLTYRHSFYGDERLEEKRFYFTIVEQELQNISGYDFMLPYHFYQYEDSIHFLKRFDLHNYEFVVNSNPEKLHVYFALGNDSVMFDLAPVISRLQKKYGSAPGRAIEPKAMEPGNTDMNYEVNLGKAKVKLQLVSLTGRYEQQKPIIESFSAKILVNLPSSINSVSE